MTAKAGQPPLLGCGEEGKGWLSLRGLVEAQGAEAGRPLRSGGRSKPCACPHAPAVESTLGPAGPAGMGLRGPSLVSWNSGQTAAWSRGTPAQSLTWCLCHLSPPVQFPHPGNTLQLLLPCLGMCLGASPPTPRAPRCCPFLPFSEAKNFPEVCLPDSITSGTTVPFLRCTANHPQSAH